MAFLVISNTPSVVGAVATEGSVLRLPTVYQGKVETSNSVALTNGIITLNSGTEAANHVETDGKGGLALVITRPQLYIDNNPAILDAIRIHEGSHAIDGFNEGSEMISRAPQGLILGYATLAGTHMSEHRAYDRQMAFLSGNLDRYNLNKLGKDQIQWYLAFLQFQRLTKLTPGAPTVHPGPPPPDRPGTTKPTP